jgi:hypothetical protein
MATPSLIVLMSLRLVIPGVLLSSRARFRFTNRQESATRRGRLQVSCGGDPRNWDWGCARASIIWHDLSLKDGRFFVKRMGESSE